MRIASIVLVLLFSFFQANVVWAQGDAQTGKARWESVAENRCQYCHGVKGEGAFGPDLAGRQLSFDQFKQAVRKPWGIMPAFPESQISDQILMCVGLSLAQGTGSPDQVAITMPRPQGQ